MPSNRVTCTCCNAAFEKQFIITCSVCNKVFKNTCVDISNSEVRIINANNGYDWSCQNCRKLKCDLKELKSLVIQLQEEVRSLKAVSVEQSKTPSNISFEDIIQEISERNRRKANLEHSNNA